MPDQPARVVMSERLGAIGPVEQRIQAGGATLVSAPLWTEADLVANGANADVLIVGASEPVTGRVLDSLPRLRCVVRRGVGVDNVDVSAASALGIPVAYVPAASVEEVSDHALALLLATERRLFDVQDAARAGDIQGAGRAAGESRRFGTLTLGIIGFGRIGRALARKSTSIFASVLAHDPMLTAADVADSGVTLVDLDRLLRESDLLSLHAPGPADHRPVLDAAALAALKPGAVVVNTARGELVDEAALLAALTSGHVGSAALDVTVDEPVPATSPLRTADGVRLFAHTAAKGTESGLALRTAVVDAVLAALAGRSPAHLADPGVVDLPGYRLNSEERS